MIIYKDTSGFTLIEILIATVIITIASLGVASLTVGIIHGNSLSKRMTTATTLVQERLEDVKRLGYLKVLIGNSTPEDYGTITDFAGYRREMSVAWVNNDPVTKMKSINVTVFWDAARTDKHWVKASTILSE